MNSASASFEHFSQQNLLVLGDVMIDRYLEGRVERISPEAPVPIVHLQQREDRLGGAANVALNLKSLGATPYICTVIGKDKEGEEFLELLPGNQLSTRGVIQSGQRRTTVKSRVLAANQQLLRLDEEDTHDLSESEEDALFNAVLTILESKEIHAILFQDYNKGVLSVRLIQRVILEAIKRDIPTAVDPKFKNFWAYKRITLFKPNLKEIRAQIPFEVEPEKDSLTKATRYLRSKLDHYFTLVTLSERGVFYEDGSESQSMPTHPRLIADVCGAGDTVFAVAGLGLSLGMDMKHIAQLANLAGGQVCEKVGVVPVDRLKLEQEYAALAQLGRIA